MAKLSSPANTKSDGEKAISLVAGCLIEEIGTGKTHCWHHVLSFVIFSSLHTPSSDRFGRSSTSDHGMDVKYRTPTFAKIPSLLVQGAERRKKDRDGFACAVRKGR